MPPNRAAIIRRRFRQADAATIKAMRYLAEIWTTVKDGHPDLGGGLRVQLDYLDQLRRMNLALYRRWWGGTERGLRKDGDLDRILEEAQVIEDPDAEVKRRRAERVAAREAERDGTP